jgi:hypothetical protein
MKNFLRNYSYWFTGAILAAGIAQPASAMSTIQDQYYGADDHNYGDVIGTDSQFNISSMDVDLTGSTLDVTINTGFAGTAGTNFGSITGGTGIGYGDLFLSTNGWNPSGSSPYLGDDNTNGEIWEYALSIDGDRFANTGGTITLYQLDTSTNDATTNDLNALLSNDFMTGGTYRNGQEVAVDRISSTTTATSYTGTWSVVSDAIVFNIDLSGSGLESTNFAFHWGMTCANDVIEGVVPAPIILLIMATGLFGVGVSTAVKRKRA